MYSAVKLAAILAATATIHSTDAIRLNTHYSTLSRLDPHVEDAAFTKKLSKRIIGLQGGAKVAGKGPDADEDEESNTSASGKSKKKRKKGSNKKDLLDLSKKKGDKKDDLVEAILTKKINPNTLIVDDTIGVDSDMEQQLLPCQKVLGHFAPIHQTTW